MCGELLTNSIHYNINMREIKKRRCLDTLIFQKVLTFVSKYDKINKNMTFILNFLKRD
jgi:hypothetical protein